MKLRTAKPEDAALCFALERRAYAGDEAATMEKIAKRIEGFPQGFVVLTVGADIVGFINSGCAYQVDLSDEAFKDLKGHDSKAPHVVILSVVVDPKHQGKGLARTLMEEFIRRMSEDGKETIHLMCRDYHVPLYEKFGYRYIKPSSSDHGGLTWHEMMMNLQ